MSSYPSLARGGMLIRKELTFSLGKHSILLVILIVAILPNLISGSRKPDVAIYGGFEFEEELGESVNLRSVTSMEEGEMLVEKGEVDAFLFAEGGELILLRNGESIRSLDAKTALENIINPPQVQIEYIDEEGTDLFLFFSFLFSFISLGLPMLLFEDDHDVMDAILMSPAKTGRIPIDKAAATMVLTSGIIFVYLFFVESIRVNTLLLALSMGALFVSLGTLIGVLALGKKNISWLVFIPALMVLIIPNRISDAMRAQIEATQLSSAIPHPAIIYVVISVLLLLLSSFIFCKKEERRKRG